jgi:hypothetical protein
MNNPFLSLTRVLGITVAGIGFACLLLPQQSFAGPSTNPLQNLEPQSNDPLAPRSDEVNSSMGIFNLIHRAQLGTSVWNSDEQNQSLNDATAAFKAKQQQMLQQRKNSGQSTNTSSQVNTLQFNH